MLIKIIFILSFLFNNIKCQWQNYNEYNIECKIPITLHGEWFSRQNGQNTFSQIDNKRATEFGECIDIKGVNNDNYTIIFQKDSCYYCVRYMIRTINVVEMTQSGCVNLQINEPRTMKQICKNLDPNKEIITMFSTNPTGKNCRSSIEGVWRFAFQNKYKFIGECNHPEANITSCQRAGTQFHNVNQQFSINYRQCEGMKETINADQQFICLGDWYVGKNHYFAVVNSRDSRIEEKYRCFLTNRDDETYMSASITAECNVLTSPRDGPERLQLFPIKAEPVPPKCTLPHNFTGMWVNTANFDSEVIINSTHMVQKWKPDAVRVKQEIYVCQERRDTRYVMARLGINGCQKDFVCFDFVNRHHNIIRYRKGQARITDDFPTVCSWTVFEGREEWKYDTMIAQNPVPIKCPLAGKFKFEQKGEILFETRIRGGVTQAPIQNFYCKENISDISICGGQKTIEIDADKCLSVDYAGHPVDIVTEPDYKFQCIGFWKENLKSYLITYDPLDAYSKYRCWIYQRTDLNKMLMSVAFSAFCHIKQNIKSKNSTEGAQVALQMIEYEREHDNCPMNFDDGGNPYREVSESAVILNPNNSPQININPFYLIIMNLIYFLIIN